MASSPKGYLKGCDSPQTGSLKTSDAFILDEPGVQPALGAIWHGGGGTEVILQAAESAFETAATPVCQVEMKAQRQLIDLDQNGTDAWRSTPKAKSLVRKGQMLQPQTGRGIAAYYGATSSSA